MTYPKAMIVDPAELQPNPFNTNILTPENEAKLEASIERLGFFKPIIVRELETEETTAKPIYEIIGGEHRWEYAKKRGQQVPIMNVGPISDQKAKEISIADNARYGIDDTIAFAELLKELGSTDTLQEFLPYTETDFADIFSSVDIALDDLEIEENFEDDTEKSEDLPVAKAPKTHTIMRFKVPLADAERLTALIASTQKTHGLTGSDELTNAGDALVQLLLQKQPAAESSDPDDDFFDLDELDLEND